MRKYTRRLAILLTVTVFVVIGSSLLFAVSSTPDYDADDSGMIENDEAWRALRDYFEAGLPQEQVIDVLFHYWGEEPVTVDVPTSTPTPRPLPTATPTMLDTYGSDHSCRGLKQLPSPDFETQSPNDEIASDIRIVALFLNPREPARDPWEAPELPQFEYGFMVRSVPDQGIGLLALVSSDKTWRVELRKARSGLLYDARDGDEYNAGGLWVRHFFHRWGQLVHSLSEGNLEEVGIDDFSTGATQTNLIMFEAVGNTYRLSVNGQEVPLSIDDADIAAVEEHIGKFRHYDDGQWHGNYNITYRTHGNPYPTTGGTYASLEMDVAEARYVTVHRPFPWAACRP